MESSVITDTKKNLRCRVCGQVRVGHPTDCRCQQPLFVVGVYRTSGLYGWQCDCGLGHPRAGTQSHVLYPTAEESAAAWREHAERSPWDHSAVILPEVVRVNDGVAERLLRSVR